MHQWHPSQIIKLGVMQLAAVNDLRLCLDILAHHQLNR
jgi:hypothetical protein